MIHLYSLVGKISSVKPYQSENPDRLAELWPPRDSSLGEWAPFDHARIVTELLALGLQVPG